jgi:Multimeric flavodoxin WrbA
MLRPLQEAGWDTIVHHIAAKDIRYCCGCKSCEETGVCVYTDDVSEIVTDMLSADLVIVASPSYWGDITGQMKVFIDRCTPFGNTNLNRPKIPTSAQGIAVTVRAGPNKGESLHLVHIIEHYLGHLEIPLLAQFTVESINTAEDLVLRPEVLSDAHAFGKSLLGKRNNPPT